MGDPGRDIDFPRFHQLGDSLVLVSCGIAAAHKCQFPGVENVYTQEIPSSVKATVEALDLKLFGILNTIEHEFKM